MSHFLNNEMKEKAKEVRNYVSQGNKILTRKPAPNNIEAVSMEIVEYLKTKYPNNFKVHKKEIPYNEYFDHSKGMHSKSDQNIQNKLRGKEEEEFYYKKTEKMKEIIPQYFSELNKYDILILTNNGVNLFTLFITDEEKYIGAGSQINVPGNFFRFMEELGLTLIAAINLYNLDKNILPSSFCWPTRVHVNDKLL